MILEKLLALICDEFGLDSSDVNEDTTLESIASDEFELQELIGSVESEFEIELDIEPADDWTIGDLAK
ncbi:MAG: acyl carrier protein, partial [Clostridia bacterium]|nr:acyl carrier protein [Clostridia bacterium]